MSFGPCIFLKIAVTILLLMLFESRFEAQTMGDREVSYRNFNTVNSDIPSNVIYKIVTDDYGYIWMATERGMVRYDGNSFRKYKAPGTDNEFIQAYKSDNTHLWLFGYSGNSRLFSLKNHTYSPILEESNKAVFKSPVILAYQKKDSLSLYRINSVFSQIHIKNPQQQQLKDKTTFINDLLDTWGIFRSSHGLSTDTLAALFKSKPYAIQIAGDVLILGNKIFQRKPNAPAILIYDGDYDQIYKNISSYTRVGKDIYLGFVEAQELVRIQNFFSVGQSKRPVFSKILTKTPVTSLASDYQGNLWVGTLGNGLFIFTPADLAVTHLLETSIHKDEKPHYISGISDLGNGDKALGLTRDKVSLLLKEKAVEVQMSHSQSLNEIRAVYRSHNKWFFFGNQNSYVADGKEIPGNISPLPVSSHTPFKDGVLFNGQYYFTTKTASFIINRHNDIVADSKYHGNNILSVAPFSDSIVFYGTNDGLYRNSARLKYFSGTRINKVRVIQNKLIVCTQEGAYVLPVERNTGRVGVGKLVKIFNENSYDVKGDDTYCYLKTDTGLLILDSHNWQPVNSIDGKKYLFSINDFMVTSNELILATDHGVYYFPKSFIHHSQNKIIPKIYITTSLEGFNPSNGISTVVYSKKLSVIFLVDVLDYTNEAKYVHYKIKCNGDDISNWQKVTNRTITLNSLKPGKYQVIVRTRGLYSGLENTAAHTLIVQPLWYQKLWVQLFFWILAAFALVFISFKWYKFQLSRAQKKMNDQLRMSELEAKNLFGQLKPHFIFNVLTPLQSFFIKGDDLGGLEYLDNYAKLMRGFLQESRDSYITVSKEMDFIRHYLFIQQRRFNNNFSYSIHIDPNLNIFQLYIPTLIIQPIVENAIEHGVNRHRHNDGMIAIDIVRKMETLIISVTDNGKGEVSQNEYWKPDHALEIIRERLELLRKKHHTGTLIVQSNIPKPGTTVIVELPILNTQP